MTPGTPPPPPRPPGATRPDGQPSWQQRWTSFSATAVRLFHDYANWLVGITWRRFFVLAAVLLVLVGIVHDLPPFTWTITETVDRPVSRVLVLPRAPAPPATPRTVPSERAANSSSSKAPSAGSADGVEISIGKNGIRIGPGKSATTAATAAASAASAASAAQVAADNAASAAEQGIHINLPPGVASEAVKRAVEEARVQIEESIRESREEAEQAARDAAEARRDAESAIRELAQEQRESRQTTRKRRVGIGDLMMQLAFFWVVASGAIKGTYKGRVQAEVKAAQATETAEAESLRRQVVEARMAAMQAQVEPHFLFNTLASIDHLIETDPPRASQMQKNLIALLRASMPSMREASGNGAGGASASGVRELGRELAVIRPYVEILKVRMEERLVADIQVPDGLLSAEFPPMMIQTLVENAIKHGLEPKAEGGSLTVKAEIVHGKLQVTVADTGLGFGKAATAGTGVGLANIRERLQLLYGPKAVLTVSANQPSGTVVTITVPYKPIEGAFASS